MSDIRSNLKYNYWKGPAGTEIVKPTTKARLISAAKGAAWGVAGGMLATMAFKPGFKAVGLKLNNKKLLEISSKMNPFSPMSISRDAAFGTIFGAYGPDIKNAIIRSKQDPSQKDEALRVIRLARSKSTVGLEKKAFWGSLARGGLTAAKTVGYGMLPMGKGKFGRFGRGLFGITGTPTLAHRAWGLGVKAGVGTGAFYGGRAAYRKIKSEMNPRSGEYTTFLRNNMLAGKIQPSELSLPDMESVRRLGMK